MAFYKNKAGQKFVVYASDSDGNPVTGDAANITAEISKDAGALAATNDVNPTEIGKGYYAFDATQAESDADLIAISIESETAGVRIFPLIFLTQLEVRPATGDWAKAGDLSSLALEATAQDTLDAAVGAESAASAAASDAALVEGRLTAARAAHLDADISSRSTFDTATMKVNIGAVNDTLVGGLGDFAAAVWGHATRTLSAFGFAVETDSASRVASRATGFATTSEATAILSAVQSIDGGGGSGLYEVVVTVQDGDANPIQNAKVIARLNGAQVAVGTTGINGTVTLNLDAGEYQIAAAAGAFISNSVTHEVTVNPATHTVSVALTAITITPSNIGLTTIFGRVLEDGVAAVGVAVRLRMAVPGFPVGHNADFQQVVTDANGVFEFPNCLHSSVYTVVGPDGVPVRHQTPATGTTSEISQPFLYTAE